MAFTSHIVSNLRNHKQQNSQQTPNKDLGRIDRRIVLLEKLEDSQTNQPRQVLISESYLYDLLTQVVSQKAIPNTQLIEKTKIEASPSQSEVSREKMTKHLVKLDREGAHERFRGTNSFVPQQTTNVASKGEENSAQRKYVWSRMSFPVPKQITSEPVPAQIVTP